MAAEVPASRLHPVAAAGPSASEPALARALATASLVVACGAPFAKVASSKIQVVSDGVRSLRVGYFGLTIPSNPKPYVSYAEVMQSAQAQVRELRPKVDVLVALTEMAIARTSKGPGTTLQ